MLADAARARAVDVTAIVPARLRAFACERLRVCCSPRWCSSVATLVSTLDAASVALFPSRVALQVMPGDARVQSGGVTR
jgi:hypothetical protein